MLQDRQRRRLNLETCWTARVMSILFYFIREDLNNNCKAREEGKDIWEL